jgi:hypothetical protein
MMHSRSGETALGRIDLAHEAFVLQTGRIILSGSAGVGGSEDT